ncbi:MAG: late competence development ComFB family protein, partial [Butyricicoccus sp.]|nr:late competence development ComFB family protein [Butyricicoccus sp.]
VAESAPVVESAPAPAAEAAPAENAAPRFVEPENPGYINVMQVLVEEKAEKYTRLAGLCQCKRCLEDVKALTLNNLPPKYVVLADGERVPRLTVYETRYSSDITSELLKACELVATRPHHSRSDP